jgi:hypothetical protein
MWAGAAGGGIWRTDNAGTTWAPVDDFLSNLAVTSLVMDPTDPNILYAGTGEAFGNVDSIRGGGIFQTRNGSNWSQIPSTSRSDILWITRLAINNDASVLLVATNSGILRSTDPQRAVWMPVLSAPIAERHRARQYLAHQGRRRQLDQFGRRIAGRAGARDLNAPPPSGLGISRHRNRHIRERRWRRLLVAYQRRPRQCRGL